uniref:Uncharacterized protein n=1 Tax=Palpitomonas bilix TaxID=652834 RepID=A0A7S3G675_9EUKA|mmetsp:Transcript_3285/g.6421  ORF Transcript_3285/g.6421 Transcript_3285/m.6421 type:complete len:122 (+) Transcript_3285:135-500(+)
MLFSSSEFFPLICRFILQEKKPFFLIKMCERFADPSSRFQLPDDTSYVPWTPGKPVPDDLIDKMLDKYQSLMKVKGTTWMLQGRTTAGQSTVFSAIGTLGLVSFRFSHVEVIVSSTHFFFF